MPKRIAVIGGTNMDIGGFPDQALVAGDSNPGRVRMSAGGVGRNIAENLVRMGLEVELITALGSDPNGRAILEDCHLKGIGTTAVQIEEDCSTSVYLFIDDAGGDMSVAINDMSVQARLTPESLEPRLELLRGMDGVVLDANLPEETIAFLAEKVTAPLFADAVSAAKVLRLKPALHRLTCFKPNRIEAELLTGIPIRSRDDARAAVEQLLAQGIGRVCLTLGPDGAMLGERDQILYLPGRSQHIVNASGAGDAFTSALVWSRMQGLSLRESGVAGMAASSIAMESVSAVNPQMCPELLKNRMLEIEKTL